MPKISIYETITPTPSRTEISNNTVYIPGYAITGPVNTPILFENLDDFKNVFGSEPYKFEETQEFKGIMEDIFLHNANQSIFAPMGSYEKSYIYASELLQNGLPVIYERVMVGRATDNTSYENGIKLKVKNWTASRIISNTLNPKDNSILKIYAKYPGKYNSEVWTNLIKISDTDYILNIKWQSESAEILSYNISLDINNPNYWTNFKSPYITIDCEIEFKPDGDAKEFITDSENTFIKLNIADSITENEKEFIFSDMYVAMSSDKWNPSSTLNCGDSIFDKLIDKGEYDIGFITSGAYPIFEFNSNILVDKILTVAATRGNSVALVDFIENNERNLTDFNSVYTRLQEALKNKISIIINSKEEDARNYGAMFSPYATYKINSLQHDKLQIMPPSFGYLRSFADSIKTNANWYATAGVARGLVPNLQQTSQNITGAIGDMFQQLSFNDGTKIVNAISINPIINIKPYGYCIWGNRTLAPTIERKLTASSFLNVRVLADDIKEVVYKTAKKLTFELNNDVLWLNFKSEIEPILDKMKSGNGLNDYNIIRKPSDKKATIEAVIKLWVVEAVEDWEINIELNDTTVLVQ